MRMHACRAPACSYRPIRPYRSNRKDPSVLSSKLSRPSFVQLAGATALVAASGAALPSNAFGKDAAD